MNRTVRRVSYQFLCVFPFVNFALAAARPLRIPGVYQTVGVVWCAVFCAAAWILGARMIAAGPQEPRKLATAGGLLLAPWLPVSLLWIGIGPPWVATPSENLMRYCVLMAGSIVLMSGFVVVKDALNDAGERLYSTLGLAATMLAGPAYLIWSIYAIGFSVAKVRDGQVPAAFVALGDTLDVLLFVGGLLTYLATAAFAASFGRARWLGRGATRAYVIVNFVAALLLVARGLSFPDPKALSTPWYTQPGFIAGVPAIPWFMPSLLGVVLLRRAGDSA